MILIVPTLTATIHGMNAPLPFEDEPWAFYVLLGIVGVVRRRVGLIFWKKDWL